MTIRLARDIGMPLVVEYAKRFGIYDNLPPFLSMSIGAGETTVLRMITGYSMFANGGKRVKATLIDRIQDRWGNTIYKHDERVCEGCDAATWENQPEPRLIDKREQVIDPLTAYQITSIMEGVIQRGTGIAIKEVGKHLAGKTGTTNDAKDLWFVGYSPNLAFGVFMGYDKPRSLGGSAQAALYTAPIFRDFMKMALKDTPDTPFRDSARHQAHFGRRPQRNARDRRRHDHGGVQARHRAARLLWRRLGRRGSDLVPKRTIGRVGDGRALLSGLWDEPMTLSASRSMRGLGIASRLQVYGFGTMRAEAEQLVEFDQAVRGTAEEASLTSMRRRGVWPN